MSLSEDLNKDNKMYIIPKGCTDVNQVVQISHQGSISTRIHCYFDQKHYQAITDQTLKERGVDLKTYIKQTESGRIK